MSSRSTVDSWVPLLAFPPWALNESVTGYHLCAREDLAGRECGFFLRGLVRVLLVGEVEAGGAAGTLVLLQGGCVSLVNAIQGAPANSPVEIIHAFSLEK